MALISLAVHGGAWDIPDGLVPGHREGVRRAVLAGWAVLSRGGSSVEAVQRAVAEMENDEIFHAGRGSFMNSAGDIELDASIMDGRTLRVGAVGAVQNVRNPVTLARAIMEQGDLGLLVGMGAARFAREHRITTCNQDDLIVQRELDRWKQDQRYDSQPNKNAIRGSKGTGDAVGAVALDRKGNLASASSTGGGPGKHPGMVSDSPLIGCGTYADNQAGAAFAGGRGESIIKVVMAKTVVDMITRHNGNVDRAANEGIKLLRKKGNGHGGIVALNSDGDVGVSFNTPRMAHGHMTSNMKSPVVRI